MTTNTVNTQLNSEVVIALLKENPRVHTFLVNSPFGADVDSCDLIAGVKANGAALAPQHAQCRIFGHDILVTYDLAGGRWETVAVDLSEARYNAALEGASIQAKPTQGLTDIRWARVGSRSVRVSFFGADGDVLAQLAKTFFELSAQVLFEPLPDDEWAIEFKDEGTMLERVLHVLGASSVTQERVASG
ncbi:hypothetical protein E4T66_17230 [Sinimarinibacterium sp. CAU 1509]|uniref:hypothetical protein n=1 Tax=Sinimarinibacterium sp. CAU 1509 TaxID=2562283 RepID=UPI0010AC352B|nr:hypothetical protein [Sinimarinibacterium sp. CAU 1509]TJY57154.1 hypothetical protein E4T66_17230 [Sinimarinibacterium sp. CAU 1509]